MIKFFTSPLCSFLIIGIALASCCIRTIFLESRIKNLEKRLDEEQAKKAKVTLC